METGKYGNGLSGLTNLGNTCFMNSCLQILSHTNALTSILEDGQYKKKLNKRPDSILLMEWHDLKKMMWSQNCVVSPNKFLCTVQALARAKGMETFTGYNQNDVAEFFLFIVNSFHCALSRKVDMTISGKPRNATDNLAIKCYETIKSLFENDYSEIWNVFYGIQVSQLRSVETGEIISNTPDPYFIISLSLPSNNKFLSLKDCLDFYVAGETLDGDNAVYNDKTMQKEAVHKSLRFWSFPNILVIELKRYDVQNKKNQSLITFPLVNLDLSPYTVGYSTLAYRYDLYGICNHSGGAMGGHYTSYVKTSSGKWYLFNDTNVAEVTDLTKLISPKAYCLFYRKRNQ